MVPMAMTSRMFDICLVDDDGAVRELLQTLFERQGWTVSCYPSAEVFLNRAGSTDVTALFSTKSCPA